MKTTAVRGKYKPTNTKRYLGKRNPTYRSLWERKFMLWCDRSDSVIHWDSENFEIPYYDAEREKWRTYYPDFYVAYYDKDGNSVEKIVEIKPYYQKRWKINRAKWQAAENFCAERGISFQVLTEKEIKP